MSENSTFIIDGVELAPGSGAEVHWIDRDFFEVIYKGKSFKGEWVEFGQCVWYLKPNTRGKYKGDSRWGTGVWLGFRDESNEILVGTDKGIIKVRTVRRKGTDAQRWD